MKSINQEDEDTVSNLSYTELKLIQKQSQEQTDEDEDEEMKVDEVPFKSMTFESAPCEIRHQEQELCDKTDECFDERPNTECIIVSDNQDQFDSESTIQTNKNTNG